MFIINKKKYFAHCHDNVTNISKEDMATNAHQKKALPKYNTFETAVYL